MLVLCYAIDAADWAERPVCKCPAVLIGLIVLCCAIANSTYNKLLFISMGCSFFRKLLDDDADEDEIIIKLLMGETSQRKCRRYIDRNHLAGHKRLYDDYFAEEPVYPPKVFRRRFRMRRSLFLRILSKLIFLDEYVRIAESTAMMSLKKFVAVVVAIFSEQYLRSPNNEDITRLLAHGQNRGFPGMLGRYYLPDGIYPKWSTFVKTIPSPLGDKRKLFAKTQQAYRKDVERAFGVLQGRFAIVRGPAQFFYHETLQDIMKACVILYNMIIEDERDEAEVVDFDYEQIDEISCTSMSRGLTNEFMEFIQVHQHIRDKEVHSQLQRNLVGHLWQLQGEL
ncbi:hypothetical protein SO802_033168 [Lithocarpus litseifolius]|uniref:DDE Tnp4 domain-containing protein n=1 Tax=Lithocarpus litseifolius TaxID=425828 RepID=A0AAW2BE19_9ROSI